MADSSVPLSVELSEQSVNVLTQRIADALSRGVSEGLGDSNGPLNTFLNHFSQQMSDTASDMVIAYTRATNQAMRPLMALLNSFVQQAGQSGGAAGQAAGHQFAVNFQQYMNDLTAATNRTVHAMEQAFGPAMAHMGDRLRIITDGAIRSAMRLEEDVTSGRTRRMRPEEIRAQTASMQRQGSTAWLEGESIMVSMKSSAKMQTAMLQQQTAAQAAASKLQIQDRKDAAAQTAAVARSQFETQRQFNKMEAIDARATADQTTAAAKIAGERRLAITKTVLRSIVMMERAFGKVVQGVARTVMGALKGVLSGVGSMASKIGHAITSPFRRANNGINDGLDGAMSKRTGLFRRSFNDQEQVVKRSVQRQRAEMEKLNQRASTGVLGALTGRGMGGGLAALAGGFSLAAFFKEGYTEAVNLNEQINKTKVLFGQSADEILNFANTSVKAFGATKAEALEAAGNFGNLFRAANINEKQAADMSAYLVNLAGDLSSFNNVPVNEVFDALRSGLVGETEPLRRFGIMLNETTLKQKALSLGFGDGKKTLDAEAKAAAGFVSIFEQTSLAQGDFTRTSKEGANAQRVMGKALKELASSIMAKFLPIATVGINMLSKAFMALNDVVSGNTSPILKTLRKGLIGAAAGVGALFAIKGLVEVFKILGPTIKLALSPLGMLIIVAAAVGAGISLLMKKSDGLREAMKSVGKVLSSIWEGFKNVVAPVFKAIGDAITTYVVPTVMAAVTWLTDHLEPAFNAVVGFIKDTVIPGLYTFVAFILTRVYPVIKQIGGFIADAFMAAVGAIRNFWNAVMPLIQPAIDGVKSLVSAIGALFSGDTSKMAGGGSDFLSGLLTSISNIAGRIGELLAPVAKKVMEWFRNLFSAANIKSMIMGILDFVETVGRVIGGIVSHPNFIKAVAALAAAAVAIGGKFIIGFAKGVIDNLPGLLGMIWDAFLAGLGAIWDNKMIFMTIATALLVVLPNLKRMFSRAGTDAGGGFFSGVRNSIKGAAVGTFDFIRGTFQMAGREVQREQKKMQKQLSAINRERRVMGAGNIGFGNRPLTDQMLKNAERDLKALQDGYSKAQLAGMRFRYAIDQQYQSFRRLSAAMGTIGKGIGTMVGSIGQAFKTLTPIGRTAGTSFSQTLKSGLDVGFMQIRTGFRAVWTEMKKIAKEQGTSVGKVAGQTVAGGIVSAVGGFMAGRGAAEAGGMGAGLFASAMSGLTAGLATGNPIIGVAAAGFGLLGSAIGESKRQAEQFKGFIKSFSDTFKKGLVDAIESGIVTLKYFKEEMDFKGVLAAIGGDVQVTNQIGENLDKKVIAKLAEIGINLGRDVLPLLKQANGDLDKFATLFGQRMFDLTTSSQDWRNAFGDDSAAVSKYIQQMMANGEDMMNLRTRISTLTNEIGSATINGTDAATLAAKKQELALIELMVAHDNLVQPVFETNSAIKDQAKAIFESAKEAMNYAAVTADLGKATEHTGSWIGKMNKALQEGTQSKDVEANLAEVAKRIEILGVNADEAKGLIDDLFDFGGGDFQQTLDQALIAVEGIGPRISGQLELGTATGAANVRENLRTLGSNLSDVIKAGIDEGTILNPADAMRLTKDIFDAATAGLDPGSDAYKQIADKYNQAISGVQPVIDAAKATEEAAKFQAKVEEYIKNSPIPITLGEAEAQVKNMEITAEVTAKLKMKSVELSDKTGKSMERNPEAFAAGLLGKWNEGIDVSAKVKVETPDTSKVKSDFVPVGTAVDQGVVKGVHDSKSLVMSEMERLARDAITRVKRVMGIQSPSKVFQKIGHQVVAGFTLGIGGRIGRSTQVASDLAKNAVDAVSQQTADMKIDVPPVTSVDVPALKAQQMMLPIDVKHVMTSSGDLAPTVPSIDRQQVDMSVDVRRQINDVQRLVPDVPAFGKQKVDIPVEIGRSLVDGDGKRQIAAMRRSMMASMTSVGEAATAGLIDGMSGSIDLVASSAAEIAKMAETTMQDELGIQSPSTVFKGIGSNVMLGFVNGIEGGAKAAADAAKTAVQTVIDAAVAGMDAGQAAFRSAATELFAGLTGSDAAAIGGKGPLAAITSLGSVTTAFQSFQAQVASSAQTAWETAKKPLAEMTAADLNILGESYVSLNATDVLGAQNLSSLTSVLDSIAAYGETLIAQGTPIDEVINLVGDQVSSFYDMAVSLGFNGDQLNSLIDQLGLSEEALASFGDEVANIGQSAVDAAPHTLPTVPVVTVPSTSTAARNTPSSTEGKSTMMPVNKTQINNIELHLPYGDPQAVALAVANKSAVLV